MQHNRTAGRRKITEFRTLLAGAFLACGTVVAVLVVQQFRSAAQPAWTSCRALNNAVDQKRCYASSITSVLKKDGISKTFDVMAAVFDAEPTFRSMCHDMAHTVGHEAYDLYRSGKPIEFGANSAFCGYGFYHGFMEYLISKRDSPGRASAFCDAVPTVPSDDKERANCYHGIGHGGVIRHEQTVQSPFEKVKDGIALCESLRVNRNHTISCVDGVIDGAASEITGGQYPSDPLLEENPYTICGTIDEVYKPSCYPMLSWFVLYTAHHNFSSALSKTELVGENRASVVSTLATLAPRLEFEKSGGELHLADACDALPSGLHTACIEGLAKGYTMHIGTPGKEFIRGLAFCESQDVDKRDTADCFGAVFTAYESIAPTKEYAAACGYDHGKYRKYCRSNSPI